MFAVNNTNLGHHGLPGGGVGGDQDGLVVLQTQHRPGLEGVQGELVGLGGLPGLKYQGQVRSGQVNLHSRSSLTDSFNPVNSKFGGTATSCVQLSGVSRV